MKYSPVVGPSEGSKAMCTEKCFELKRTGSDVTRRAALVGGAAVAASAVMGGTASAGERGPASSHRRHGLRDLTHIFATW
jgi:hypothetical protein